MRTEEFKDWLQIKFPDSKTTVDNRISNCNNVEKYYGDLDVHFSKDKCKSIVNELTYSTNDERAKTPQRHKVLIKGNIRTGSATLKLAVNLYVEFREYLNEVSISDLSPQEVIIPDDNSDGGIILREIRNHITEFKFDKKKHKDHALFQSDLTDYLILKLIQFSWEIEHKPSDVCKDRIDIFGVSKIGNYKIVIELDAHRADQVAKKFISRSALFINDNLIYLSVCYPGTKRMSKPECMKYFDYCSILSKALSGSSNSSKFYAGLILK